MSEMRSYGAARSLFSFLGYTAWAMIAFGLIGALNGANKISPYDPFGIGFVFIMAGIVVAAIGLFFLAIIQNARATVDTAEYTQQMLKIARDQLEVSKQSLNHTDAGGKSFATLNSESQHALSIKSEVSHQGHTIQEIEDRFHVGGEDFERIEHAKNYIDNNLIPQEKELLTQKPTR